MTQSFGIFSVPDGGKAWDVKGSGASLWNYDNHVVKVQGIVDSKAASPVLYAQSVQDTGQPCGSAATASAKAPAGTAAPATTSATATTAPAAAQPAEPQQQPGGGVAQNAAPAAPAAAQPSAQSTTGVAAPTPQTSENKGTPAAGSPQGAIASNSGASNAAAAPSENYSTFNGCLMGTVNDYQYKSNGKTYRLQGNTSELMSLLKHNVEITGEDFNGKAIQVNGARDLGTSCK
jgi:hypothetical protein